MPASFRRIMKMSTRTIMEIDQDNCDGCGACESGCPEGALRVIGGKARLVGESLCDGLGACIGTCPRNAIRVTKREAADYDEIAVLEEILPQGEEVLVAHFAHLDHFGQDLYLGQAIRQLTAKGMAIPKGFERFGEAEKPRFAKPCGLQTPGLSLQAQPSGSTGGPSAFPKPTNWPIQLHLVNPRSPQFGGASLVVAADCTGFALASFHASLPRGAALVIACPKLDHGMDLYAAKLAVLLSRAASITVLTMEVPCCSGLLRLVGEARKTAGTEYPIQSIVVGTDRRIVLRKFL
jgi:ferredoxin